MRSEAEGLGAKVCILEVNMKGRGLEEEFHGDYGENASLNVLTQTFTRSCELMRECADYFKGTLLYDAVYSATHEKLQQETGRKALIVLTDGEDQGSMEKLQGAPADRARVRKLRLGDA